MSKIRIGTRGSKLALAQTKKVIGLLAKNGIEAEYVIIKTSSFPSRVSRFPRSISTLTAGQL